MFDFKCRPHSETILHRDLKPDNIIVRNPETDDIFIVDYGLSFNQLDDDVTQTDETFRNRFLDLPETNTTTGSRRSPVSDLTALCAVFYFMLTGNSPGHLQDAEQNLPHRRRGCSLTDAGVPDYAIPHLNAFFDKGLAVNLDERFQTVDELSGRLKLLHASYGVAEEIDPIEMMAEFAVRIRQNDSKTRIAGFRQRANKVMEYFVGKVADMGGRTPQPFVLMAENLASKISERGRPGDWVSDPVVVSLSIQHHPTRLSRTYLIQFRNGEFLAVYCDAMLSTGRSAEKSNFANVEWIDVCWFADSNEDLVGPMVNDVRKWLTKSIPLIARTVLP